MEWFLNIWSEIPVWVSAITGLVTAATAIPALTPSHADNRVLDYILTVLNIVAGNLGHNRNADAE